MDDLKPGWQTSEWWTAMVAKLIAVGVSFGVLTQSAGQGLSTALINAVLGVFAIIAVIGLAKSYVRSRTDLKIAAQQNRPAGGGPAVLPFLLAALAIGCLAHTAPAQGTTSAGLSSSVGKPAARGLPLASAGSFTRTSLFGIAELRQMNQQTHDRLLALEAAQRQQQSVPAPQSSAPQLHYHFWNGGPGGQTAPSRPAPIIVSPQGNATPHIIVLPYNGPLTPPAAPVTPLTPPGPPVIPLTPPGPPVVPLTPPGPPVTPLTPPAPPVTPLIPPGAPVDPKLPPPGSAPATPLTPPGAAPAKPMPPASETGSPQGYQQYIRGLRYTHALAKPIR